MATLPTYEQAVAKPDVWEMVAPYLDGTAMTRCCAVSKHFNRVFAKHLWANPVKIIFTQKRPCRKLLNFMWVAKSVRYNIRNLVITIDMRPLLAYRSTSRGHQEFHFYEKEITGNWIGANMLLFPNLKFTVLDELIFEGVLGGALTYVDPDDSDLESRLESRPARPARRVSASVTEKDPGFTAQETADNDDDGEFIEEEFGSNPLVLSMNGCGTFVNTRVIRNPHTKGLIYLDISGTLRTDDFKAIYGGSNEGHILPDLRILKMRNLRLTDGAFPPLVIRPGSKLWSLDIRNNLLTDKTLAIIQTSCFRSRLISRHPNNLSATDEIYYDDAPGYNSVVSNDYERQSDGLAPMRRDDLNGVMAHISDHDFPVYTSFNRTTGANDQDDFFRHTGLTHLYLSGNRFSENGIQGLLQTTIHGTNRLQVLDVGVAKSDTLKPFKNIPKLNVYSLSFIANDLRRDSAMRLKNLRIHHSVITDVPTLAPDANITVSDSVLLKMSEEMAEAVKQSKKSSFAPEMNHRIHTLTLTSLPRRSKGQVIDSLETFLLACAIQEQQISELQQAFDADIEKGLLSRRRIQPLLTGLRVLRLEFLPDSKRQQAGPSVSGDDDADEFMAQSENDFSFFSSNDRQLSSTPTSPTKGRGLDQPDDEGRDVVEALKLFRKSKNNWWSGRLELTFPNS